MDSESRIKRPIHLALLLIVAGVIGWAAAFALTLEKIEVLANPSYDPSCDISPLVQCSANLASSQGSILGFPNSLIGIAAFIIPILTGVALLAGAQFDSWYWIAFNTGLLGGLALVMWFVTQSIFVLGTLCPYCIAVWMATILMFFYVGMFSLREGYLGNTDASREIFAGFYPFTWLLIIVTYAAIALTAQLRLDAISLIILHS